MLRERTGTSNGLAEGLVKDSTMVNGFVRLGRKELRCFKNVQTLSAALSSVTLLKESYLRLKSNTSKVLWAMLKAS